MKKEKRKNHLRSLFNSSSSSSSNKSCFNELLSFSWGQHLGVGRRTKRRKKQKVKRWWKSGHPSIVHRLNWTSNRKSSDTSSAGGLILLNNQQCRALNEIELKQQQHSTLSSLVQAHFLVLASTTKKYQLCTIPSFPFFPQLPRGDKEQSWRTLIDSLSIELSRSLWQTVSEKKILQQKVFSLRDNNKEQKSGDYEWRSCCKPKAIKRNGRRDSSSFLPEVKEEKEEVATTTTTWQMNEW